MNTFVFVPLKFSQSSIGWSVVLHGAAQDLSHILGEGPLSGLGSPRGVTVCGVVKSVHWWLSTGRGGGGGAEEASAVVRVEGLLQLRTSRALLTRLTELGAHQAQVP